MNNTNPPSVKSGSISSLVGYGLAIPAIVLAAAVSGWSQTSEGMSQKKVDHPAASTNVSAEHRNTDSSTFDSVSGNPKRTKFITTGLSKQIAAADDSQPAKSTGGRFILATSQLTPPPVPSQPYRVQGKTIVPPAKILTTLAVGESLDQKIKNATGVVIVDFYADWCGPCRRQGAILHDMEGQASQNHATIIKVNIDQHRQLARQYRVSSLPTLIAVKKGKEVRRNIGLANESQVASLMRL